MALWTKSRHPVEVPLRSDHAQTRSWHGSGAVTSNVQIPDHPLGTQKIQSRIGVMRPEQRSRRCHVNEMGADKPST